MSEECIFCKIVAGKVAANFEYKSGRVVVFPDIHPQAPIHFLIVPQKHIPEFAAISPKDQAVWDEMIKVVGELIDKHNLREKGYRLLLNGGPAALVQHLHLHLLGEVSRERAV